MIIGIDRAFKPEWVYKILKLSKPGLRYKDLEPEFNAIIETQGLKSKKNIMTIIRRYYLKLKKVNGFELFDNNYLHDISVEYTFDSIKPLLLLTLLCRSDVARFIQEKINLKYMHNGDLDRQALYFSTVEKYGDRRIVRYVVGYYLKILEHFGILEGSKNTYQWLVKKMICPSYVVRDMVLLYGAFSGKQEINTQDLKNETPFTYVDLSNLEDVLREFNGECWRYQKMADSNRIIIMQKITI